MFWAWYAIIHLHYHFAPFKFFHNHLWCILLLSLFYREEKARYREEVQNFVEGQLLGSYRGWFCTRAVWITPLAILSLPFFTLLLVPNHDERGLAHSFREGICYQKPGWLKRAPDINVTNSSFNNRNHPFWNAQRIKADLKKPMW